MKKVKSKTIKVDIKKIKAIREKIKKQMKEWPDWKVNALNSSKV